MMDASVANWWCIFSRRFLSAMTCSFTLELGFRPPLFFSVVDDEQHFPTVLPVATLSACPVSSCAVKFSGADKPPAVKENMLSMPPALTTGVGQRPLAVLRLRSPTNAKPFGGGVHCCG